MPSVLVRRKLQPTAVAGQPLVIPTPQPQVQIPEPAAVVGVHSRNVYSMIGDNPQGPETVAVQPPAPDASYAPGPEDISLGREGFSMMGGMSRPVSMAEGGFMTVGTPPPFDMDQYTMLRRQQRENQWNQLTAQAGALGARQAVLPYSAAVIGARQATLPFSANVLSRQAATFPLRSGVIQANRQLLGARGQSLAARRGLIGQEQAFNAQDLADLTRLIAAKTNVADQNAVGEEALRRGVENQDYQKLGVAAPVDVNTAPGQEGSVAPWTRATLKTQADIVGEQNQQQQAIRANQLHQAQLAVDLQDTNVTEAQNAASAAGLSLDEANQLVEQARNAEGFAQLSATGAGYNEDLAQLRATGAGYEADAAGIRERMGAQSLSDLSAPQDQGFELYTDPVTRERRWVTPAEADQLKFDYEQNLTRQRIPTTYETNRQRSTYQNQQQGYAAFDEETLARVLKADPSKWAEMQQDFIKSGLTVYEASAKVGRILEASRRLTGTGGTGSGLAYGSGAGSTAPGTPAPSAPTGGQSFTFTP